MELNDKDIFSKIRDKKSEINIIYKNKYVTAFKYIYTDDSINILIILNKKFVTLNDITEKEYVIYINNLFLAVTEINKHNNIDKNDYELILNINKNGCQEILYIHIHLLNKLKLMKIKIN